jgi:hypothetical protein
VVAQEERVKSVGICQAAGVKQPFAGGTFTVSGDSLEAEADPRSKRFHPRVTRTMLDHWSSFDCRERSPLENRWRPQMACDHLTTA